MLMYLYFCITFPCNIAEAGTKYRYSCTKTEVETIRHFTLSQNTSSTKKRFNIIVSYKSTLYKNTPNSYKYLFTKHIQQFIIQTNTILTIGIFIQY